MSQQHAYKFDFDSEIPIPAHDPKPSLFNASAPWLIDNLFAIDIILVGAWACNWVYHGGSRVIMSWFMQYSPALYRMATTGQL